MHLCEYIKPYCKTDNIFWSSRHDRRNKTVHKNIFYIIDCRSNCFFAEVTAVAATAVTAAVEISVAETAAVAETAVTAAVAIVIRSLTSVTVSKHTPK